MAMLVNIHFSHSKLTAFYIFTFTIGTEVETQRGMVLPFQPLTMSFRNISYYVDVPGVY